MDLGNQQPNQQSNQESNQQSNKVNVKAVKSGKQQSKSTQQCSAGNKGFFFFNNLI